MKILVQKTWVTEEWIEVDDDATCDEIYDAASNVANSGWEYDSTTIMNEDDEYLYEGDDNVALWDLE